MKKIIILILLISSFAYSQVDTANYNFQMSQLDGKFYSLISKNEVFGSAGFRYQTEILQTSSIDTTQFQYVPELSFGYYSMIENVASYYGKDSGLVRMMLYSNPNSTSIDTSTIPFLNQNNTFTGAINTFTGKMVVGTGTSNGTADLLVMGDTTTIRGTLYRDSSYLRVLVNPFSQRIKFEMIGKTGTNMFTIDSTLITSALAMTITGDFTTGGNIFAGSNNKQIGWNTRALMQSLSDGNILFTNWAGTTKATLSFGKFKMDLLPTYADNTAALAGGLTAGDGYKTSSGVVMITY